MRFRREIVAVGAAIGALVIAGCASTSATDQEIVQPTNSAKAPKTAKPKPEPTPVPSVPASWSPQARDKTVYLTFDDGPGPNTDAVLDVLKANDVKATFFIIGKMIRTREAQLQRVYDEGHVTGNHTWDHANLAQMKAADIDRQLNRSAKEIGPQMGPCMRPPYGALSATSRKLSVSYGMTPILWTKDTNDWNASATKESIANVLRSVRPGDVVLMHDGGGDRSATVAALREVLPTLKAKGYTFDVVPSCKPLANNPLVN